MADMQNQLQVFLISTKLLWPVIEEYKNNADIVLEELESPCTFDLFIKAENEGNKAKVRISDYHTNVVHVSLNDEDITERYRNEQNEMGKSLKIADRSLLNVKDIVEFAETVDLPTPPFPPPLSSW